jgi:uncharacterized protein YcbK (DUF882 family)
VSLSVLQKKDICNTPAGLPSLHYSDNNPYNYSKDGVLMNINDIIKKIRHGGVGSFTQGERAHLEFFNKNRY